MNKTKEKETKILEEVKNENMGDRSWVDAKKDEEFSLNKIYGGKI